MLTSEFGEGQVMNMWRFAVRWVVPPAITFILIFGSLVALRDTFGLQLPGFLNVLLG